MLSSSYKFLTRLRPNEYDRNIYHTKEQGMIFSSFIGKRKRNTLHTPDDGKVRTIFVFLSANKYLHAQKLIMQHQWPHCQNAKIVLVISFVGAQSRG